MDFDLKSLAKDKRAWIGVGGAAGLGAFVYYRRKKTAAAAPVGTSTAAAAGGTAPGGAGAATDTTGYDMASFLGNYSQALQDQLTAGLNAIKATNANPTPFDASGGESLRDLSLASGVSIDQIMALNPNLSQYLKDANQFGFISATNPANRPGGGEVQKVFWTGAPVKLK